MIRNNRVTVKPVDWVFEEVDPREAWYSVARDVEVLQDEIMTTLRQRAHVQRRIEGRVAGVAFRAIVTKGE